MSSTTTSPPPEPRRGTQCPNCWSRDTLIGDPRHPAYTGTTTCRSCSYEW